MSLAYLPALGLACNLGIGKSAVAEALFAARSALQPQTGWIPRQAVPLGGVEDAALPAIPAALAARHDNRNNRLLLAAALEIQADIQAAIDQFGPHRIGVVLGTSTAGIEEATAGVRAHASEGVWPDSYRYADQELGQPAAFLSEWLQLSGPSYAISTACTSSARALLSAQRLLRAGLCDAVLCGGVDTLARLPINGFHALEALSGQPCLPFSANRRGISIGEAAALFLMRREKAPIALLGGGASADAYHMSSPEPSGAGALAAMQAALRAAGLQAAQIDYLNLHGTATELNDAMESLAVSQLFDAALPCASTKALSGHTLGAAGALEAAFCWLSLADSQRRLPPHHWDGVADPALPALQLAAAGATLPPGPRRLMSNSFAFGGNNASLILGDAP